MVTVKEHISDAEIERVLLEAELEDRLLEYIDGEFVEKIPKLVHGVIVGLLVGVFYVYLKTNPIGYVAVEVRYREKREGGNHFIPDISFHLKTSPKPPLNAVVPFMPDLAVEVQPQYQSKPQLLKKALYYLENGAKIVWLIYPEERFIEVLTPTDRHFFGINDTLVGGSLLPDFSVTVQELFQPLDDFSDAP